MTIFLVNKRFNGFYDCTVLIFRRQSIKTGFESSSIFCNFSSFIFLFILIINKWFFYIYHVNYLPLLLHPPIKKSQGVELKFRSAI